MRLSLNERDKRPTAPPADKPGSPSRPTGDEAHVDLDKLAEKLVDDAIDRARRRQRSDLN